MQNQTRTTQVGKWLNQQPKLVFVLYTMLAAFAAYASMYAFRKPFTATGYEGLSAFTLFGVTFGYKSIAVISQLLGYMSSKFIGIKVASEATMKKRVPLVLGLILFAELMLLGFALCPRPYNLIFLFLNGLPLGMVWSLIFGILEGRRVTEFLGLAMSISIIFSSGIVKAVGRWTMDGLGVAEFWMPVTTGAIFIPLLLLALTMLYHVPPPTPEDRKNRTLREPMNHQERRKFVRTYLLGVVCLVFGYLCLMTYRDIRDSFMNDILKELGHTVTASDFAGVEIKVGLLVIVSLLIFTKVKSHRSAVFASLSLISIGALTLGSATLLLQQGMLSPLGFYLMNGVGLYMAFVPYQVILVERLLASLHTVATASFLIALADSYGYLSTVSIYLLRDILTKYLAVNIQWLTILNYASLTVMIFAPLAALTIALYFNPKLKA
ncbi:DUF5690 family protein [Rubritalea tangerina]|uniref:DUF5690 family protein n=1 Tax=Rubritalea tangerina TaxID=430798 RepID=A0ABW4ZB17_9BACT